MPLNGNLTKREITALENSYLSYEGAIGTNNILYDMDELLLTRGNGLGLKLYDRLLDDPHISAVMGKLAGAVAAREWTVTPGSDKRLEKKAADIVREQLSNLNTKDLSPTEENHSSINGFDALTKAFILGGVMNGRHFAEIMWSTEGDRTVALEARSREPRQFAFAKGNYGYVIRHLTKEQPTTGVEVPLKKILVWSNGALDGNPYGRALGRVLFWPNFFKKNGIRFWLKFVERFAAPKPTGKYPRGATPQQVAELRAALAAFANETEIAIPDGMLIEYLEAASSGTVDTYQSLCAFMDAQISRAVLGETGTTDQTSSGGSRARDQVGNEVRLEISKAIADSLSATFNRLAQWITDYNVPGAIAPKIWRVFDEQEDLNGRVGRDKILFDLGYRIDAETVASVYGNGYAEAGGEADKPALISSLGVGGVQALTGLLTQAATGQLPKENAIAVLVSVFGIAEEAAAKMVPDAPKQAPQTSPLDQLFGGQGDGTGQQPDPNAPQFSEDPSKDAAELIADKARPLLQDAIAPWLDQVRNFVEQSTSLEDIRDGLVNLFPELDDAAFAEAMGQAMLLSDLAGREEVLQDDADVAFAEMVEKAIATGPIEFAASSGKKPNCTAGKSHFCQTPNGKGSCVPLKKRCKFKPTGAVKTAATYTGQKVQAASPKTASEQLRDAIASNDPIEMLDLGEEIYLKVQTDTRARGDDFYAGIKSGNGTVEDHILKHLYAELGYDAKPEILTKAKLEQEIQGGEIPMYRAVGSTQARFKQHFDNFKNGDYFAGHGIYGHGTYVAMAQSSFFGDRAQASASASSYGSGLIRMTLKRGSKVATHDQVEADSDRAGTALYNHVQKQRQVLSGQALSDLNDKYRRAKAVLFGDNGPPSGRFATLAGYDAVSLSGRAYDDTYTVLVNRGAVRVQSTSHTKNTP